MAEKVKTKKPKKDKSAKKPARSLELSVVAVVDNIVFSKKSAMAYYKITNRAYDFLASDGRTALASQLVNAFNALMQDKTESMDGHLIATSVPVDVEMWREQVETLSEDWQRAPGFFTYMNKLQAHLDREEYNQKIVYIGIDLGKRGALDLENLNIMELGVKGALDTAKKWVNQALAVPIEDISADEEDIFRRRELNYRRILETGHLGARPANAEEILLLIKRQLHPSMPAPYLDVDHGSRLGAGDLAMELGHVIENKYRFLKISQIIGDREWTGYRATLSLSKFPRMMEVPGNVPFLYFVENMGFPYTTYSRFRLHPSKKMKKELEKKKKEQRDELINMAAGMDGLDSTISGTPAHVQEAIEDSQTLGMMLDQDKSAWFEGSFFIAMDMPTEDYLKKYALRLKQAFADHEITLTWTSGDQMDLFLSQMPGDHARMTSFDQITSLSMLPASGFNFSSEVGDSLIGNDGEAI